MYEKALHFLCLSRILCYVIRTNIYSSIKRRRRDWPYDVAATFSIEKVLNPTDYDFWKMGRK